MCLRQSVGTQKSYSKGESASLNNAQDGSNCVLLLSEGVSGVVVRHDGWV